MFKGDFTVHTAIAATYLDGSLHWKLEASGGGPEGAVPPMYVEGGEVMQTSANPAFEVELRANAVAGGGNPIAFKPGQKIRVTVDVISD